MHAKRHWLASQCAPCRGDPAAYIGYLKNLTVE
jgi:hypothetical protein